MSDRPPLPEARLLSDVSSVVALNMAFRLRLFERLALGPVTLAGIGVPESGGAILLALLDSAGVTRKIAGPQGDEWHLTPEMAELLTARGPQLRQRAEFIAIAAADMLQHGDALLHDPAAFMQHARTFRFFRYDRALGTGAAHLQDSQPWVDYVSTLTADEAPALAPLIPVGAVSHLLEIGGNTGVFALSLLARHADLRATVLDLPAVCRLGQDRLRDHPGADRLGFLPGDARAIDWPAADAVLFKSVLHDWTAEATDKMLAQAARHIPVGGRVIVCERGAIAAEADLGGAAASANLVFSTFYRDPEFYEERLSALGLRLLPRVSIQLDMAFHVVTGERVI